jgi:peroxin-2
MSIPASWQLAWDNAQPRIQAIRHSLVHTDPSQSQLARVGQLDAEILDQELLQVLKEPISKALGLLSVRYTNAVHVSPILMISRLTGGLQLSQS